MNERIEEQARAAALVAAAQQKNTKMQAEVQKLKEQLSVEATEREKDKEKIQQLEQQLESTSNKIREELRQEFFSLIKQHNQAPPLNATPTTTAPQPEETAPQPEEFTTNTTTSIYNKVSENEVADLAQAGTETTLATHNEPSNGPTVVPTPSQGPEDVQQTVADSVLLTKQMRIPPCRLTRSNANRSLFTNDKGSSESVRFITSQTLRNSAANKKRDTRKKGGKDNQP
ncbi:hypothetical protein BDA96_02G162300 [Sorghum bicolor]|uniref:Uncharacterized protein n=2 Tax=Sorghum bicolor TaxID=4558 RepID=A0A921UVJ7_SORBI|nr:uncharacterized protein LOC110432496 [Sorghum bicolor]KAG0543116.1 hypothetical protein BDA96_02G162300 [Sorghum bicolor]KXG35304.1 hypothetical protein SORBI_3002G155700 [Sorghum bicolor]|eukprot:XP_021308685.1 uncharacterized protein LOC110432496 [Sorghum bicolor]